MQLTHIPLINFRGFFLSLVLNTNKMKKLFESSFLKLLFFAFVVAYIITAFSFGDGFEMNLNPFNWDIILLIKFIVWFVLVSIIESFFVKRKKTETNPDL